MYFNMIYKKKKDWFIGHIQEYPDYESQGRNLDELRDNLVEIYNDINQSLVPDAEPFQLMEVAVWKETCRCPLDDQEYVAEIIAKQLLEFRREHLADRIAEARANYKTGERKSGSFDELMEDLENDWSVTESLGIRYKQITVSSVKSVPKKTQTVTQRTENSLLNKTIPSRFAVQKSKGNKVPIYEIRRMWWHWNPFL
jgi:hypothetical protein